MLDNLFLCSKNSEAYSHWPDRWRWSSKEAEQRVLANGSRPDSIRLSDATSAMAEQQHLQKSSFSSSFLIEEILKKNAEEDTPSSSSNGKTQTKPAPVFPFKFCKIAYVVVVELCSEV